MRRRFKNARQAARILGYRSGLESTIGDQLKEAKVKYEYEGEKIKFIQPEKKRTYTPDFVIVKKDGSKMYIETKGRLMAADKKKHEWIKEQHPELDIRFIFSNSSTKFSKTSKSTYGSWAAKLGFQFADKVIPKSWLLE